MGKIFRYELWRLLWNKIFLGILAVTLGWGWVLLRGEVILGVADTAPFSPWSFGYYLARLLPMLCLGELFFLGFFTSGQERRVRVLTRAAPMDTWRYAAVRCAAVLAGTLLLCLSAAGLYAGFCAVLFGWRGFGSLLVPFLLVLLPPALFCAGLGWRLGNLRPELLYGLMAGVFLLSLVPLPQALDFSMGNFFQNYPLDLGVLDPAFSVPGRVLAGRAGYLAVGLLAASLRPCRAKRFIPSRRNAAD